uniref:Uncharacterized protein n=1 Tax=Romanomermis culicivorax TaxID=13658 RepID=A0A915I9B4_ROMCU
MGCCASCCRKKDANATESQTLFGKTTSVKKAKKVAKKCKKTTGDAEEVEEEETGEEETEQEDQNEGAEEAEEEETILSFYDSDLNRYVWDDENKTVSLFLSLFLNLM